MQVLMTYFLDFFLMSLKMNDLIADEKKEKKDKNKKMNDLLFI